jgi:peptidoglycan/LPS O-acetylase OafA/YrhL
MFAKDAGMPRLTSSRVECLDGLRGLAALWVLTGHCVMLTGWSLPVIDKPDLGVDLFMMLSGFLMVLHYQERSETEPWSAPGTWFKFWTRRYFRISPLYYVVLVLVLALGPALLAWRNLIDTFGGFAPQVTAVFTDHSLTNIGLHLSFLFGLLPIYAVRTPLPDWSLGLEMQFYFVFPALMLLTRKLGWALTALSTALLAAIITHATWHLSIRFPMPSFLPFKIDIFLVGMLIAKSCHEGRKVTAIYFMLVLILAFQPLLGEGSLERLAVREVMAVVFFSLIQSERLPSYLGYCARNVATVLSSRAFRWLGEVSYGTYLWHLFIMTPVVALIILHWGHDISAFARFAIAFSIVSVIVYPLSWLTFKFIETPGQAAGRAILRRIAAKAIRTQKDRTEGLANVGP